MHKNTRVKGLRCPCNVDQFNKDFDDIVMSKLFCYPGSHFLNLQNKKTSGALYFSMCHKKLF